MPNVAPAAPLAVCAPPDASRRVVAAASAADWRHANRMMGTARHARSPRSGSPPGAIAAAAGSWLRTVSRRSGLHRTLGQLAGAHALRRRMMVGLVVGSFAGVYLLGDTAPGVYVVPIVLAAIEFGVAGGLAAGLRAGPQGAPGTGRAGRGPAILDVPVPCAAR